MTPFADVKLGAEEANRHPLGQDLPIRTTVSETNTADVNFGQSEVGH